MKYYWLATYKPNPSKQIFGVHECSREVFVRDMEHWNCIHEYSYVEIPESCLKRVLKMLSKTQEDLSDDRSLPWPKEFSVCSSLPKEG